MVFKIDPIVSKGFYFLKEKAQLWSCQDVSFYVRMFNGNIGYVSNLTGKFIS